MAKYAYDAIGGASNSMIGRFIVGATHVANQFVIWDGTNGPGESADATTTSLADALGLNIAAVIYSAAQNTGDHEADVIWNPMAVYRLNVQGGATNPTALTILVNDTADATGLTFTDTGVGTADLAGGSIVATTGANRNARRVITTHNSATSIVVTEAFDNTLAQNDEAVMLPWDKGGQAVQLTTDLVEADGSIATGTGGNMRVVDVQWDATDPAIPTAEVFGILSDHFANPLS